MSTMTMGEQMRTQSSMLWSSLVTASAMSLRVSKLVSTEIASEASGAICQIASSMGSHSAEQILPMIGAVLVLTA